MIQPRQLLPRIGRRLAAPQAARFILRRFRRNQKGATAVEFAMVAMPFVIFIFAIIETALAFWTSAVLDTAVTDASRRIYTGQFQQENAETKPEDMPGKFRDELCKGIKAMFTCANIKTDVRVLPAFASTVEPQAVVDGKFNPAFGGYQKPGPNQIVVVRAAVEFPVFLSLLYANQTNLSSGNRLVMATATFRTEPYAQ